MKRETYQHVYTEAVSSVTISGKGHVALLAMDSGDRPLFAPPGKALMRLELQAGRAVWYAGCQYDHAWFIETHELCEGVTPGGQAGWVLRVSSDVTTIDGREQRAAYYWSVGGVNANEWHSPCEAITEADYKARQVRP